MSYDAHLFTNSNSHAGDIGCRPGLDAKADVMTLEIADKYSYLILCCDGVYDAFEPQIEHEFVDIIRARNAGMNFSGEWLIY